MFGFLKDKIKKAIQSISEKIEKKEEPKEEIKEEIQIPVEEKPVEIKEEVKIEEPAVEKPVEIKEEIPEEKIEQAIEEKNIDELQKGRIPELKPELKVAEESKPLLEKAKIEIEEKVEEKPKEGKKGFFKRIVEKIVKPVVKKVVEKKLSEEDVMPILAEMETGMIEADVAYDVAEKIKNDLKNDLVNQPIRRGTENEIIVSSLRKSLLGILSVPEINLEEIIKKTKNENRPAVLLFFGFNGHGKTTSIAKAGKWLIDKGFTVAFAAGDSWRQAAIEQLEEHGKKLGVNVIKHNYGADPAAIIYDGVAHCKAKGINVLLGDTAGRSHINKNLIDELKKIVRVNKPDLKILILDSTVGNDAVAQSQMFNDAIGIDAVMFTKIDVNEKGGAILSVSYLLKIPILFLGTGQNYSDLVKFDKISFVDQLLGE
jgi:fused signal recognition particle receptor